MNESDWNTIVVALIEKYGLKTGAKLLAKLIQETNKPTIIQIPTPDTKPNIPSTRPSYTIKWGRDITMTST